MRTLTLLSSPELTRTGWPATHSNAVMPPSCAPRTVCNRRPLLFRSHSVMCPASVAVARTGWLSAQRSVEVASPRRSPRTTSERKSADAALADEYSNKLLVRADIVHRYFARREADAHDVYCGRLCETSDRGRRGGRRKARRGEVVYARPCPEHKDEGKRNRASRTHWDRMFQSCKPPSALPTTILLR
jgi:hypothetical protein